MSYCCNLIILFLILVHNSYAIDNSNYRIKNSDTKYLQKVDSTKLNKNKLVEKREINKQNPSLMAELFANYQDRLSIAYPMLLIITVDFILYFFSNTEDRSMIILSAFMFLLADLILYTTDYLLGENKSLYSLDLLSVFLYNVYPLYFMIYSFFELLANKEYFFIKIITLMIKLDFCFIIRQLLYKKEITFNKKYDMLPDVIKCIKNKIHSIKY